MKVCTKCGGEFELSCFYRDKQKTDGLSSACKTCKSAQGRTWAESNREASRRCKAAWQKRNPTKVLALTKAWQSKNPEKVRASYRKWAKSNPDKVQAWALRNPDKARENAREWAKAHPEYVLDKCRARRARLAQVKSDLTARDWLGRVEEFDSCCAYCLEPLARVTLDHFRPLAKGGEHTLENVVPACGRCNSSKSGDLIFDWLRRGIGLCQPRT